MNGSGKASRDLIWPLLALMKLELRVDRISPPSLPSNADAELHWAKSLFDKGRTVDYYE